MVDSDVSFYPTQYPKPINALDLMSQYNQVQHGMGENKLLQQEIRGRTALGRAVQASTDPQTGVLNNNKLNQLVAQDPDANWMALKISQDANSANPLTPYMGRTGISPTNPQGTPTPMQGSLGQVRAIGDPSQQAGNAFQQAPPAQQQAGNPFQQQPPVQQQNPDQAPQQPADLPQIPQDKIDKLHAHNQAMLKTLTPLVNDPDLDHKKVIGGVSDLVTNPDADFNHHDGAAAISAIPFGQDGKPVSGDDLRAKLQPIVAQQQAHEQYLTTNYPSSQQIAARKAAAALAAPQEQPDQSTPGSATGLPAGYTENQIAQQTHYHGVLDSADSAQKDNAALSNILNLSKLGAPTGQVLGSFYTYLAKHDLAPVGAQGAAEQLQFIHEHAAQIAASAGSRSDQDLLSKQLATVSADDLPKVIQGMVPYLEAVNESKVAQANYYQQKDPTGSNPTAIASARSDWRNVADPRIFEMRTLAKSDPEGFKSYISGLDPSDANTLMAKYQKMFGSKKNGTPGMINQ